MLVAGRGPSSAEYQPRSAARGASRAGVRLGHAPERAARSIELAPDTVLAIAPSNAVHTFRMQFPIDVLFVRRDGVVVKVVLNLEARRIAAAFRAFAVLEFATGSSTVAATEVGDRLELETASRRSSSPAPSRSG